MKIDVFMFRDEEAYFSIFISDAAFYTSKNIANLFNLDIDYYNNLVIDKVIKHEDFTIDEYTNDLAFKHNNISKEIYINRFKEVFADQLTLLALDPNQNFPIEAIELII